MKQKFNLFVLTIFVLGWSGCEIEDLHSDSEFEITYTLQIQSGNLQEAAMNEELENPLVVQLSSNGGSVENIGIKFANITQGVEKTITTNQSGIAQVNWTLGDYDIKQNIDVSVLDGNATNTVSFQASTTSMIDSRDGQRYPITKISDQIWIAQNLGYAQNDVGRCYVNSAINCLVYGRLYSFDELMQGAAPSDQNPSGVQGLCPQGWHVPSQSEYSQLLSFNHLDLKDRCDLWGHDGCTNTTGFALLPSGSWNTTNGFISLNQQTTLWTSTVEQRSNEELSFYGFNVWSSGKRLFLVDSDPADFKRPCRCLKD